jgi:cell division inhibitor SepF
VIIDRTTTLLFGTLGVPGISRVGDRSTNAVVQADQEGRPMGAWRKAGVWLGLVEDDDRHYADDDVADDISDFDEGFDEPVGRARVHSSRSERAGEREHDRLVDRPHRFDRPTSRAFGRANAPVMAGGGQHLTHDNLALAPQAVTRERAVVEEEAYRITTLHPTTYNEARTIGEHFREHVPVIMNLSEMDEADAKRLVDFSAGLAFGLRGSIERVTNRVFLLSPPNVSVTAEDKAKIAEGGFFNQS